MLSYQLKLDQYEGPLAKLLDLIEERKLEVNTISLGQVTDDFLNYLSRLEAERSSLVGKEEAAEHMRFLADFIVVASRLVFLKSKSLIPDLALTEEEEADIKDLESRLKIYRELKPAMKHIVALWGSSEKLHARPYFLNAAFFGGGSESAPRVFYPGRNVNTTLLKESLANVFHGVERFVQEEQVIREKIVTLEEKMTEVVRRIALLAETSFRTLSGTESRGELVVTFLAILHLAREQAVLIEQEGALSDIIIRRK